MISLPDRSLDLHNEWSPPEMTTKLDVIFSLFKSLKNNYLLTIENVNHTNNYVH